MPSNIREFDAGIERFQEETIPDRMAKRLRAIGLEGLRGVIKLTPVRDGFLKGNWQLEIVDSAPAGEDLGRAEQTAVGTSAGHPELAAALTKLSEAGPGSMVIWIHNGLHYAAYVNDGTNRSRAFLMVEKTADRIRRSFGAI